MINSQSPTLVIIDMQPKFTASLTIAEQVIREAQFANSRDSDIIVVELSPVPKNKEAITIDKVMKECGKKKAPVVVTKYNDDGSNEIMGAIKQHGIYGGALRICGVNRNACVRSTIRGLIQNTPDSIIEVVWDATADVSYDNKRSVREYNEYPEWIDNKLITIAEVAEATKSRKSNRYAISTAMYQVREWLTGLVTRTASSIVRVER